MYRRDKGEGVDREGRISFNIISNNNNLLCSSTATYVHTWITKYSHLPITTVYSTTLDTHEQNKALKIYIKNAYTNTNITVYHGKSHVTARDLFLNTLTRLFA